MIKKYIIEPSSLFNKNIMLSMFEHGNYGFDIVGLNDNDIKDLFPVNKIKYIKKELDVSSIPSSVEIAYLDEDHNLKALILKSSSKKYYLFKVDHQKEFQLNINQKYISHDLNMLMDDYEKHCKTKGKSNYDGVGDFELIKDIDYFENRFYKDSKHHLSKESNIFRLVFSTTTYFTTDFIDLVGKKVINITNQTRIDSKVLTLESMQKNRDERKDCLLINSETKDIIYFVFTYKPHLINHYFLFKNLGNNQYEYVFETVFFNEIFAKLAIKYRKASKLSIKSFAKMGYDNFSSEFVNFEAEEEFDEEVKSDLKEAQVEEEVFVINKDEILEEVLSIIKKSNMALDINITYHGKERMLERIGNMDEKEMLSLAKVAYEKGLTSVHFLEKDPIMFRFLQHKQSKITGKILKIYKDILFFFSLEPPHDLVTCFPYKSNYDLYVENIK